MPERPPVGLVVEHAGQRFRRRVFGRARAAGEMLRGFAQRRDAEVGQRELERRRRCARSTFSGFKSRCRMRCAWMPFNASAISLTMRRTSAFGSGPARSSCCERAARQVFLDFVGDAVGDAVREHAHDRSRHPLATAFRAAASPARVPCDRAWRRTARRLRMLDQQHIRLAAGRRKRVDDAIVVRAAPTGNGRAPRCGRRAAAARSGRLQ